MESINHIKLRDTRLEDHPAELGPRFQEEEPIPFTAGAWESACVIQVPFWSAEEVPGSCLVPLVFTRSPVGATIDTEPKPYYVSRGPSISKQAPKFVRLRAEITGKFSALPAKANAI